MIRETYIAPTEWSPTLLDVKRALLTYDRVYLADPTDRDLMPSQCFMLALGMPPLLNTDLGPVRLLGKSSSYDSDFDSLMDSISIARRQGLIEVVSSYNLSSTDTGSFKIGIFDHGGYPLDPSFMLWAFRSAAKDQSILDASIRNDPNIMRLTEDQLTKISEKYANADMQINDDAILPTLESDLHQNHLRDIFTYIARARISSTIKSIGYCASKNMVPIFTNQSYGRILSAIASRAANVIDVIAEEDPHWVNRNNALKVCHDEYLNEQVLDLMTVDDVIRLRTKAWGDQAQTRDALLNSVASLAKEFDKSNEFQSLIEDRIRSYRKSAQDVIRQRSALSFNVTCDVVKASGALTMSSLSGKLASGAFSQMQIALAAGTALLAGCIYGADKLKDLKKTSDHLKLCESEFSDNACFGIHNFYRSIGNYAGSSIDL